MVNWTKNYVGVDDMEFNNRIYFFPIIRNNLLK